VLYAQRSSATDPEKNIIFLTISATDVPKIDVKLTPTSLTFTGTSTTKKTTYHVELEFYAEIDVENSKTHHTSSKVEFVLRKKEVKEEYWPRLLKESKKVHFLKTDFDKAREQILPSSNERTDTIVSGLMRTNKTPHLMTTQVPWAVWVVWAVWVECLAWREWAEWVEWVEWAETEALVALVSNLCTSPLHPT